MTDCSDLRNQACCASAARTAVAAGRERKRILRRPDAEVSVEQAAAIAAVHDHDARLGTSKATSSTRCAPTRTAPLSAVAQQSGPYRKTGRYATRIRQKARHSQDVAAMRRSGKPCCW